MDEITPPRPYRHGNLPNAMRSAARAILDEAGPDAVGLRETARRVGVSATAAYRHFSSKEDLLASVAAEGFRELVAAMESAVNGPDPLIGLGLAYVEFALQKRGLFRLMFGPILVERSKYPAVNEAAGAAFEYVQRIATSHAGRSEEENAQAMAACGLVHGLSALFIDGVVPESRAGRCRSALVHSFVRSKGRCFSPRACCSTTFMWAAELYVYRVFNVSALSPLPRAARGLFEPQKTNRGARGSDPGLV